MPRSRKTGDRHGCGKLKRVLKVDHGTDERRAKTKIELEETMDAGIKRARVAHECLLDVLYGAGDLGNGSEGTRRYDAGLWLRRLYQRTHDSSVVWIAERVSGNGSEMSDEQAVAHRLYRRTMLVMGPEFGVLRQVCCDDRPGRLALLTRALDRLANWRGM